MKSALDNTDPDNNQVLWLSGVYGFLDNNQNIVRTQPITKDIMENIRKNPSMYNAKIIGQGVHFKKQEAKKYQHLML